MEHEINLSNLACGAVQERFEIELQKVIENISDPNTEAKKMRKLQLSITFKPNANRDITSVQIDAKTTLAPAEGITTAIYIDMDRDGRIVGREFAQGKLFDEAAASEESESKPSKVSYLEQKQAGRV